MHLLLLPTTLLIALTSLTLAIVTCLKGGQSPTAAWTNAASEKCIWIGVLGSNHGTNAAGGEYIFCLFPSLPNLTHFSFSTKSRLDVQFQKHDSIMISFTKVLRLQNIKYEVLFLCVSYPSIHQCISSSAIQPQCCLF